ncbi:hypothetical protein C8R43DRAFT_839723, partial [Mycena crocata]
PPPPPQSPPVPAAPLPDAPHSSPGRQIVVHQAWTRKDMNDGWGDLVEKFLDFEEACGYVDKGTQIGIDERPTEIWEWLRKGRRWHVPPKIKNLGRCGEAKTYVDNWWLWWRSIQPGERDWVGGMLTWPNKITWGSLTGLCGKNGFMQIMASLLFWGIEEDRTAADSGWDVAVSEVQEVLAALV